MAVFSDCQERGVKKLPFNVYYTKKRQDDANLLSTSQEDKWLVKKEKMNYPAASSGVSKTTTGKILRPKGRGIHPDGNKNVAFLRRRRQKVGPITLRLSPPNLHPYIGHWFENCWLK